MPTPTIVHGIRIESRHDAPGELRAMTDLAHELYALGIHDTVTELFYDSKNCICEFKFTEEHPDFSAPRMQNMLQAAKNHLTQFDWGGYVEHYQPPEWRKPPCPEGEEAHD